jgi:hypothetical protein
MEMDGEEFVIERLFRGSIMNYETFFMLKPKNKALMNMRLVSSGVIKVLTRETME